MEIKNGEVLTDFSVADLPKAKLSAWQEDAVSNANFIL